MASGSDDGFVKLWDPRVRRSVAEFMNQYQVTAVCLSRDDQQVMSGGIDNEIKVFDVRKLDIAYTMTGHNDTVTGAWVGREFVDGLCVLLLVGFPERAVERALPSRF